MHYSDNMDGNQGNGGVSANSSSDFVSRGLVCPWKGLHRAHSQVDRCANCTSATSFLPFSAFSLMMARLTRMLKDVGGSFILTSRAMG